MRQILFRAKPLNPEQEEWVISITILPYIDDRGKVHVTMMDGTNWIEVNPETIGQFTGLRDTNGKEIYDGDIIRVKKFLANAQDVDVIVEWDN